MAFTFRPQRGTEVRAANAFAYGHLFASRPRDSEGATFRDEKAIESDHKNLLFITPLGKCIPCHAAATMQRIDQHTNFNFMRDNRKYNKLIQSAGNYSGSSETTRQLSNNNKKYLSNNCVDSFSPLNFVALRAEGRKREGKNRK